jgi:hypothetical protein
MSNDAWVELLRNLAIASPGWVIAGILAYRSPQLVKAFFDGVAVLLKLWLSQKMKKN